MTLKKRCELKFIDGDLIKLAKEGMFDVIIHGCNCFCKMRKGLALQMANAFNCDTFPLEHLGRQGDIGKLGCVDYKKFPDIKTPNGCLYVVNAYTQYHWQEASSSGQPVNYAALQVCFTKINQLFKGKKIGIPRIGAGLAGGEFILIKQYIERECPNEDITVVSLKEINIPVGKQLALYNSPIFNDFNNLK
jgi:O-acetyl-ADP-ribose deacetylase (regulator of RNase III)